MRSIEIVHSLVYESLTLLPYATPPFRLLERILVGSYRHNNRQLKATVPVFSGQPLRLLERLSGVYSNAS